MVDTFIMATKDDDILQHRKAVGFVLVISHTIGRGEDNLVVMTLRLQLLDKLKDRLALHNHTCLATERIVVGGLTFIVGIVVEVMYHNLCQALLLSLLED